MNEKDPLDLIKNLNDFFNDKTAYIPRVCFSETNSISEEGALFAIFLTDEMPKKNIESFHDANFNITSFQTELIDDKYITYCALEDSKHDESAVDHLDHIFKNEKNILGYKISKLSPLEKNPFTYPAKYGEKIERALCLDMGIFHAMYRSIPNSLGSGGDYLMYMSGVSMADGIWNKYKFSDYDDFEDQFLLLEDILRTLGLGIVTFLDIDPLKSEGKITIKNSFEGSLSESCTMFRGLLTELVKRIFEDQKMEVIETACVNKGDPECVFELARINDI